MSTNNRFDPYAMPHIDLPERAAPGTPVGLVRKLRDLEDQLARLTAERDAAVRAVEMGTVVTWLGETTDTGEHTWIRVGETLVHVGSMERYRVRRWLDALTDGLRAMLRWEGDARKFPPRPGEPAR